MAQVFRAVPAVFARPAAMVAIGLMLTLSHHAAAQNLVQNPNFFNGLAGYTTSADSSQNVFASNFPGGPTNPDPEGTNSAVGNVSISGTDATIAQSLATTPNTVYMVTFAYAMDPSQSDSFTVTFGNVTRTFNSSTSDGTTPFETVSFLARTGSGSSATLTFDGTEGAFAISELDVEAGPAPVTGGGVLSASVLLAGFALRRLRRRASAAV